MKLYVRNEHADWEYCFEVKTEEERQHFEQLCVKNHILFKWE
jgi:hypothetical protein